MPRLCVCVLISSQWSLESYTLSHCCSHCLAHSIHRLFSNYNCLHLRSLQNCSFCSFLICLVWQLLLLLLSCRLFLWCMPVSYTFAGCLCVCVCFLIYNELLHAAIKRAFICLDPWRHLEGCSVVHFVVCVYVLITVCTLAPSWLYYYIMGCKKGAKEWRKLLKNGNFSNNKKSFKFIATIK